jgi:hypothetical protein
MPGENVELVCDLVHDVPAEIGSRFTLREGGKTSKLPHLLCHAVVLNIVMQSVRGSLPKSCEVHAALWSHVQKCIARDHCCTCIVDGIPTLAEEEEDQCYPYTTLCILK